MKLIYCLLVLSSLLGINCTTSHSLINNEHNLNEINNTLKEENVTILFEDGTTKRAKNLDLSPSSTSWTDLETEREETIETERLGEIRVLNPG